MIVDARGWQWRMAEPPTCCGDRPVHWVRDLKWSDARAGWIAACEARVLPLWNSAEIDLRARKRCPVCAEAANDSELRTRAAPVSLDGTRYCLHRTLGYSSLVWRVFLLARRSGSMKLGG